MSTAALARRLREGELSPREAVLDYLDRIERLDPDLNAYISVQGEQALTAAHELERAGRRGPLWGVPVGIKDVIDVAGVPTTAASAVLGEEGRVPREDSTVVERLKAAGAIVLGKLNTHEFAYGATTTSRAYGPARNAWDRERIAGGSSGGSGVAAAAELAAGTLGSDTAGSIRIPAAFNGVTGLRPSTGLVPNRGSVQVAATFDTLGPIARSAEDCALLLEAIAGRDRRDPGTVDVPVPRYSTELSEGIRGLRVGVVEELFEARLESRIATLVRDGIAELAAIGASVVPVRVPWFSDLGTIQQAVQFAEAAQYHGEWLRTRLPDYGADVRARLLTGLFLPSTVPVLGQRARRLAVEGLREVWRKVDLLVAPTMPVLPPRIGDDSVELNGERILYRLTLIPFNSPWSCLGLPALTVPCGCLDGMPVGMALVGRRFDEATVLRAGHAFQRSTDWHERRPPLPAA